MDYSQEKIIEVTRLIGKNSTYIRQALKKVMITSWGTTMMVRPMKSIKDKKGRVIATTRMMHYANTALIAKKIADGLYRNDQDFCKGVSTVALGHDIGQGPFGHDGEVALKFASEQNNGGPRLHNIEGTMKYLYRYADTIKDAINSGKIINDEAKRRNITREQLKDRIKNGFEPELKEKIEQEAKKNGELVDEAVKIFAIAAGNHNGERGTSHISPNIERTFEQFFETAKKTFIDANEDKNMESCNMVDAIVKISDQISSITFDIIDAKRAGIEDEIFEGWSEPISQVLGITEEEARKRLKGNNKQLYKLSRELQDRFIEDVIKSSNQKEIKMSLAPLLYGATDERGQSVINGLRTFNMTEHTAHTATAESEVLLNNAASNITDMLVGSILDEKGTFPSELNEIFRISQNNPIRRAKENRLINNFHGDEVYRAFFEYVSKLSPEEYKLNKSIVKKREVQYYREMIEKALRRRNNIIDNTEIRSPRNSTGYLIEEYMLSPNYEAMIPDENDKYSDEEVKNMIDRINAFLNANPIGGIKHLSLLVQRYKYQLGIEGESEKVSTQKIRMNTDQQIAARIAISYLNTLNDLEFINLASELGVLSTEERKVFELPYIEYSSKRLGESGHKTESMKKTQTDYVVGTTHAGKLNKGAPEL